VELRFLGTPDALEEAELDLRWRVLRAPLGHPREATRFPFEAESLHLVALEGPKVVGCVLFHPEGPHTGRLFQMAVEPALQGKHIGQQLVRALESEVAGRGFRTVTLHAREGAVGFYARLGYAVFGEPFSEVGIPHRHMRRQLQGEAPRGAKADPSPRG
jgi:ribosomal protein S18 acetylase RimI-like enzyme